ncbi:MAG: DNA repair protein RecN, partial [Gammaproteobacteria bacterium]|nr:DNA repair protein RecN [Gammaproteobacteria bacterium]
MIEHLQIRQLAIAERLELQFGDAFTAVTGETGSGKSLIVEAVGVLLGGRCDNRMIRRRQERAEVQGGFTLGDGHPALQWLRDNALDSDSECILRREVRRDKPSRAFINGRAVTAAQLRALGAELVDIHSQNEHHRLLRRDGQLALLDRAAGNAEALAQLAASYEKLVEVRAAINRLNERRGMLQERADLLRFQTAELEELAPLADEWPQLEAQQKRMHHAQDLADAAAAVASRLGAGDGSGRGDGDGGDGGDGGPGVGASLAESVRQLQRLVEFDPRLAGIIAMLEEAAVNLGEAASQLQSLTAERALDPKEIAAIEARFSQYHELARKHRTLPGLLAAKLDDLRGELAAGDDPAAELQRLGAQWSEHKAEYDRVAAALSARRRSAGRRLEAGVTELMQELGMAGGGFEIRLQPTVGGDGDGDGANGDADGADTPAGKNATAISRHGAETVEFAVSANPGQPLQALAKVASGGELSRISLAINVVLAADAPASTLIFDEVDVGIGGRVADVVGRKLRDLGAHRQIICITHLPQVAARGHQHWSVAKQTGRQTSVDVRQLDHRRRIDEIARMTAGAELTPQSIAHA